MPISMIFMENKPLRLIIQEKDIILLFTTIVVYSLIKLFLGPLFIDDAYIYFRYVENSINGNGLVFNPGQYILGTTSLAYTVLLIPVSVITRSAPVSSLIISYASQSIIIIWIYIFSKKYLGNKFHWYGIFLFVSNPILLANSLSGMETSLLLVSLLSALGFYIFGYYLLSSIITGFIAIIRPESIVFILVYLLYRYYQKKPLNIYEWMFVLLPLTISLVYQWKVYKELVPHSVIAKSAIYPKYLDPFHNLKIIFQTLADTFSLYKGDMPVFTLFFFSFLFFIGVLSLLRKNPDFIIFIAWISILGLVYSYTNRFLFPWYIVPFVFCSTFVLPYAIHFLWERIEPIKFKKYQTILKFIHCVVVVIFVFIQAFNNYSYIYSTKREIFHREEKYKSIAYFLNKTFGQNLTVASVEIGSLGYFYRGKIFDLVGLVSPESIKYYQSDDYLFEYPHKIPKKILYNESFDILVAYDLFLSEYLHDQNFALHYDLIYEDNFRHDYYGKLMVFVRSK